MTRTVTPQQTHPSNTGAMKVPHDKVAQRAYEKWCKRGCQHGHDRQDWLDAEAEIRAEMSRQQGTTQPGRR
jgi:hypothetical protein